MKLGDLGAHEGESALGPGRPGSVNAGDSADQLPLERLEIPKQTDLSRECVWGLCCDDGYALNYRLARSVGLDRPLSRLARHPGAVCASGVVVASASRKQEHGCGGEGDAPLTPSGCAAGVSDV